MELSNNRLIAEAVMVNHARVGEEETRGEFERCLVHFSDWLASVYDENF